MAEHHYKVEKKQVDNRVVSNIVKLTKNERITEIAKLISGDQVSKASFETAKQLLN
jgi:DNA repair protein RecN (Recombination protein N)